MTAATPTHCMLYVTAASKDEARTIARTLVEERLAACANILGDIQSIYRWDGKIEEATEVLLIAKTQRAAVERALARIKSLHSYEVPCAVVYDMANGLAS